MATEYKDKIVAGFKEDVTFVINGISFTYEATLDTGNGASASTLGCELVEEREDGTIRAIIHGREFIFPKFGESYPKVGQVKEKRLTVLIETVRACGRKLNKIPFALVDNRNKSTNVLLNREFLSAMGVVVDPARKFIYNSESST